MLVELVELRQKGRRLTRDQVSSARRYRGWLTMDESRPMWIANKMRSPLLVMLLDPTGEPRKLLEPLDEARVRIIQRGSMLILGKQDTRLRGRHYDEFPQVWWARVIGQPERPGGPVFTGTEGDQ